MLLKYSLFTGIIALIPYCLFVDNYPATVLKPVKDYCLDVLLHFIGGIEKTFGLGPLINSIPKVIEEETAIETHSKDIIFTETSLKNDAKQCEGLFLSILGNVFDVSKGEKYYGSGGSYNAFAGK